MRRHRSCFRERTGLAAARRGSRADQQLLWNSDVTLDAVVAVVDAAGIVQVSISTFPVLLPVSSS